MKTKMILTAACLFLAHLAMADSKEFTLFFFLPDGKVLTQTVEAEIAPDAPPAMEAVQSGSCEENPLNMSIDIQQFSVAEEAPDTPPFHFDAAMVRLDYELREMSRKLSSIAVEKINLTSGFNVILMISE